MLSLLVMLAVVIVYVLVVAVVAEALRWSIALQAVISFIGAFLIGVLW